MERDYKLPDLLTLQKKAHMSEDEIANLNYKKIDITEYAEDIIKDNAGYTAKKIKGEITCKVCQNALTCVPTANCRL